MEPVSSVIYETLMRQAIANGRGRTRAVSGMDTGERSRKAAHPAIGHRHGGETGPMGKEPVVKRPAKFRVIEGSSKRRGVSTAPLRLVLT